MALCPAVACLRLASALTSLTLPALSGGQLDSAPFAAVNAEPSSGGVAALADSAAAAAATVDVESSMAVLRGDDECLLGEDQHPLGGRAAGCGVNLLQRHAVAKAPAALRAAEGGSTGEDAADGYMPGSCSVWGCSRSFSWQWGQLCGCYPSAVMWKTQCRDYHQVCGGGSSPPAPSPPPSPPSPPAGASCATFGCGGFKEGQACQCNPECVRYRDCCSDYSSQCTSAPTPSPWPGGGGGGFSDAPTFTFYVYRAQSSANYPPKSVNVANLPGVLWYLSNEVVIENPPKFGITRILRYKVQTKAPSRLFAKGLNFGVRYAYDSSKCTGPGDCVPMYRRYGYFVGCNNFKDHYPFPTKPTHYAGGQWFSLPAEGACAHGSPTGADDCTYSYSWPPAEVTLAELVAASGAPALFWKDKNNEDANKARVNHALGIFSSKYYTEDLPDVHCDFDFQKFWR
mmetsp:Transcript_36873/g.93972  ORF Transcript_36873/g.93972 Transcript_36873/m.93972 type:complete len:456 (-) Transcript_36873:11-1378(-)